MRKAAVGIAAIVVFGLSIGGGAVGMLASRSTSNTEASRATSYASVADLARDSALVAVVKVDTQGQREVPLDARTTPPEVVSKVTVVRALPSPNPAQLKVAPKSGDSLNVYQVGTLEQAPGPILEPGGTYLLFLTPTELEDATARDFFPVGVWAGIYRLSSGATFTQTDAEGDDLPATLTTTDLGPILESLGRTAGPA
jgi:hypothetical protein